MQGLQEVLREEDNTTDCRQRTLSFRPHISAGARSGIMHNEPTYNGSNFWDNRWYFFNDQIGVNSDTLDLIQRADGCTTVQTRQLGPWLHQVTELAGEHECTRNMPQSASLSWVQRTVSGQGQGV